MAAILCLQLAAGCRVDSACRGDLSCDPVFAFLFARADRYFAYVPLNVTLRTDIYRLDPETATLTLLAGSTLANTIAIEADPTARFMYGLVFSAVPNNVRPLRLDTYTGLLDNSSSISSSANNQPSYADFHPSGRFMYVANFQSLDVSAFSIDQTTGNLTKIADTATSCACANLAQIRVSPNGRFLYVTYNGGANAIASFSINQDTGALSLTGSAPSAATTDGVVVDPTSSYLYAVATAGNVAGFAIDQSTGVLTALPGSPYAGPAGSLRMAMHPSGRYIYTVNVAGGQLAKHDIAANGSLSSPTTIAFGSNLQYVTIDPSGRFGFVNDGVASSFYVFLINQSNGNPSLHATYPTSNLSGNIRVVRTNGWL